MPPQVSPISVSGIFIAQSLQPRVGVSCLISPFPSSPAPSPPASFVHGILDHFAPPQQHRCPPPALHDSNSTPVAPPTSLLFLLIQEFSKWGPQTHSSSIHWELVRNAYSRASCRPVTSESGVGASSLEFNKHPR